MPQIQVNIQEIPATIMMNSDNKSTAFRKTSQSAFIDNLDGVECVWGNVKATINNEDYVYNHWHRVFQDEESPMKTYFGALIRKAFPLYFDDNNNKE